MPNTWADLNYGPRAPTYSEYQFIASKAEKLPMTLTEAEYNDLMQNGIGKSGPLAWANAIQWRMFSLMEPKVDASEWLRNGYDAMLRTACKQLVADRDKAEEEASEKRLALWRKAKKREWEEMERNQFGETENELVRYEFTSIRILSLAGPDMSGNSLHPEIKLEAQQESWTFGQPSNGSLHQLVC
jgi:hypothetical protein